MLMAAACGAAPQPQPKSHQQIAMPYVELDHFHGGYEINIHVQGDGFFQLLGENASGLESLMYHENIGGLSFWATWYATLEQTEFYVLLYNTRGHLISVVHLPVVIDSNPL